MTNNVKQFKYKLLNNIIATNENLCKWKITDSPDCINCKCKEDYEHFLSAAIPISFSTSFFPIPFPL